MSGVKEMPLIETEWLCLLNRTFGVYNPEDLTEAQKWEAYELLKHSIRERNPKQYESIIKELTDWLEV